MVALTINDQPRVFSGDPETPLLWVLRDVFGLTGTKFGCGAGMCGACTVHIDGQAVRACTVPASAVDGAAITTIEGLGAHGLHPVQEAWRELEVPQCGYCQPGMVMAVAALLRSTPAPSDADIADQITNICRCGTYDRVRRGIALAARKMPRGTP